MDVKFHDTTSLTIIQNQATQLLGNYISVKASWVFDWPDHRRGNSDFSNTSNILQPQQRQQTWSGRLQAAMVDGEQGWITKDDPVRSGIQFTRALEKHNLVYDRVEESVQYENCIRVGSSGIFKFHKWGCDE